MNQTLPKTYTLFHGSRTKVEKPSYGKGNPHNDYGLGFYCTESKDLACEWACPDTQDGYVNEYTLDASGLRFLDLDAVEKPCLRWLTILIDNRRFDATTPLMEEAKGYLLERFLIDMHEFDVVTGYRADDSYFSFARAFLDNRLSLNQLERALRLGELGKQVVLKSPKAFEALSFVGAGTVDGAAWHPKRCARDVRAREEYRAMVQATGVIKDDLYMIDLLRGA